MDGGDRDDKHLLDFIGALYDAAAELALWPTIAAELARLFHSESCMLLTADARAGGGKLLGATENLRGRAMADYADYYYAQDEWLAGGLRRPGQAVLGRDIAPAEWYAKSEFLNELCLRAGVYDLVGGAIPLGGAVSGIVGIHRPKNQSPFDEGDVRRLDCLIPHLKRAMQLTLRLSGARIDYQAALDGLARTGTAIVVTDANGIILFASSLAEMLLRHGGGLRAAGGRLTGADRVVSARLGLLINAVTGAVPHGQGGGIAIERDDGKLPLTILVTPFRPHFGGLAAPLPAALIFIRDPEAPAMAADILRDLFGFTPAQAAVAARVAEGESLDAIAATLRISHHTVRDHLKIVFAKTGTRRQSQLAAMLAPTVAALRPGDCDTAARTVA
jgi:DNA-binding CsgD family transcriptional regulator